MFDHTSIVWIEVFSNSSWRDFVLTKQKCRSKDCCMHGPQMSIVQPALASHGLDEVSLESCGNLAVKCQTGCCG